MVFIVLGAVKAAKHAKAEYHKDKKRNSVITPIDGSHDMMADRNGSSGPHNAGNTDWWGTTRAQDALAPTPDAPANHEGAGAWSRDHTLQQIAEANSEQPPSAYASSASESAELSAPTNRSLRGQSASTSPTDPVEPASQRSGDLTLPASIERECEQHDAIPEQDDPSELAKRSSRVSDSDSTPAKRQSKDGISSDETRMSRNEDSAPLNGFLSGEETKPITQVKQQSRTDSKALGQARPTKQLVEGSFEESLRRKPSNMEEGKPAARPEQVRQTVSALARNASKGLRKTQSQLAGTTSAPTTTRVKVPVVTEERVKETVPVEAVSALARNASKGPRRKPERAGSTVAAAGSFEASMENSSNGAVKKADFGGIAVDIMVGQKVVSAFAGTCTKRRGGRRPPAGTTPLGTSSATQQKPDAINSVRRASKTTVTSTEMVGSSMYAEGSMKKRTSRS